MSNLAEKLPVEVELETQALSLYEQALQVKVIDQPTFAAAGELGKMLRDLEKKITDYFKPLKEAAHAAHKAITTREGSELSPVKEAMDALRKTMNGYLQEQERIRREEQAKLEREERERAEKERQRLLAQAVKAEDKGQTEKAEEKLEQAEMVYAAPVTVAPKVETAKFDGGAVGQVKEIQITVTDVKAFLAELVKRGMAPTMVEVKVAPLKAWQKANDVKTFPGLHIVETMSARIR